MSITTNLALNEPAYNSTSPTWDQPLNYNSTILDQMYGNTTSVAVSTGASTYTNIAAPSSTAAGSTSQAMRINFTGALSANQNVLFPQSVAGLWVVTNSTSGSYTVSLWSNNGSNIQAGTGVVCPQGYSVLVYCDGTNVRLANDGGGPSSPTFTSIGVGTPASGTSGEIRATNNITAYYSDDRLKNRLGGIENALDKVLSLTGFYYEANETAQALGYAPIREVGISAQDVQAILPEIVAPAPIDSKYLTVRYERLVPLLIEAIKELTSRVKELEAE
jgi:hypothetical protein